MKNVSEPMTGFVKDVSKDKTKTIAENSIRQNIALEDLNEKVLELMHDKSMIAPYLASSLVNLLKPQNTSQFKLIKRPNSIRMTDFFINMNIPVNLYNNFSTFRDNKSFKLDEDHLKTMKKYTFNIAHSNWQDQKSNI